MEHRLESLCAAQLFRPVFLADARRIKTWRTLFLIVGQAFLPRGKRERTSPIIVNCLEW